jgi:hypothetical protein
VYAKHVLDKGDGYGQMAETLRLLDCTRKAWKINENKFLCLSKLSGRVFEARRREVNNSLT